MNANAKRYFSLLVRENGKWAPQFGDYSKSVVKSELREWRDNGAKAGDLKIVEHDDSKAALDAAIARLNQ